MSRLLSRTAFASIAFKQAKKFIDSPKGRQFVATARQKASDPATRAKVNDVVAKVRAKAPQR